MSDLNPVGYDPSGQSIADGPDDGRREWWAEPIPDSEIARFTSGEAGHVDSTCLTPTGWDPCNPVTVPVCSVEWTDYYPYMISLLAGCGDTVDHSAMATDRLERTTNWMMSRELSDGALSGSPSFQSTATIVAPDPVSYRRAVGVLTRERGRVGPVDDSLIHVGYGATKQVDNGAVWIVRGNYDTVTAPVGGTDADPEAGEAWIYITGPVQMWAGDIVPKVAHDYRSNQTVYGAKRMCAARFSPCGVFAAKAVVM